MIKIAFNTGNCPDKISTITKKTCGNIEAQINHVATSQFKEYVLSVKDLIEMCQLSGESAYKELRDTTFSLIEKGIRISYVTNPEENPRDKSNVSRQALWNG